MILFLLYKVTVENKRKNYYFDKFLLERYLYSYAFTKVKVVPSFDDLEEDINILLVIIGEFLMKKRYFLKNFTINS